MTLRNNKKLKVHEMIREHYPEYYSIERYPADRTACIRKTADEWGVLGNFYMANVVVNGVTFDCTERLFHMMKLRPDAAEGIRDMMEVKAGMGMKMHLKHIAKEHPEWFRDDWPSMIVDAMKCCLQLKYEQCELFRKELERSKGLFIAEDETSRMRVREHVRDADTWGVVLRDDEYVGPSLLGRLLMELREDGKLEYTLPEDALDFVKQLNH